MKRKGYALVLFILLVWVAVPRSVLAKSYYAERYDVDLAVQPGGALDVTETVVLRFEGGPYTYFFREIELNRLDSIENVRAYIDGQLLPAGSSAGQVEIEPGNPLRITWHMPPTSDTAREFRLEYTVLGAVRANADADQIIWRAIPEEHEYDIQRSQITIHYPEGVQPFSAPQLDGASGEPLRIGAGAGFTISGVDSDEEVDVSVSFPAGSLVSQPPAWQLRDAQQRQETRAAVPYGLGAAGLVGLFGAAVLVGFLQRARRDDMPPLSFSSQQQTPPGDLPPALAAKLAGGSNPALATLFDLAQRGVLRIEMEPGFLKSKKFALAYVPGDHFLRPHEAVLIDALFSDRRGQHERISFSELGSRLGSNQKQIDAPLALQLKQMGWVDETREGQRNRLVGFGVIVLILGVLVPLAAILPFPTGARAVLIGAGIAMFLVGFAAIIAGSVFSTYTAIGLQQAAAWKSFGSYLKDVSRGREAAIRPDMFELYLPFAAGFGIASGWSKFFESQQNVPLPAWLLPLENAGMRFSDVTAAIIASQSASSSASAGGAAAGASGGGASGAG